MKSSRAGPDDRFRTVDRLPMVLGPKRIRLLPTRFGIAFCLVLAAMLLGAANHNNNFAFLMTFLLAGIGMVGLFLGRRSLTGIEVQTVFGAPVFAGDRAVFTVSIRNPAGSRPSLEAAVRQEAASRFSLAESETKSVDLFLQTDRRGIVSASPLVISTVYPMGLVQARAVLRPDVTVPVFPKPAAPHGAPYEQIGAGKTGSTGKGPGAEDFDGLQPYRPGDPIRRIAWKALSKERGLAVKHFSGAAGGAFFLDWQRIPEQDGEKKLSILCGWVLEAERMGIAYGLRLPGRSIAPGAGPTHKLSCLTALAEFGKPEPES